MMKISIEKPEPKPKVSENIYRNVNLNDLPEGWWFCEFHRTGNKWLIYWSPTLADNAGYLTLFHLTNGEVSQMGRMNNNQHGWGHISVATRADIAITATLREE